MGTPLGLKYIPHAYMDPLGEAAPKGTPAQQWKHGMQQVFYIGPCSDCFKFVEWVSHICIIVGVQGLQSRGGVQGLEGYSLAKEAFES